MKKFHRALFIVLIILFQNKLQAQQQLKGIEMLEIVKISEAYRAIPNLSFSIDYTYADSANTTLIAEQLSGISKVGSGLYWTMIDSVESLQGSEFNIVAYHSDSTIVVSNRSKYGNILRVPFLDSAFRKANVDSLRIDYVNSTTKELVALFKPGGPYSKYVLRYNPQTYLVNSIEYYLKDSDLPNIPSGTAVITVSISNYSTAFIDPAIFNEGRFIYRQNGQLAKTSAFSNYALINNSSN
jgi:hypothetical protein